MNKKIQLISEIQCIYIHCQGQMSLFKSSVRYRHVTLSYLRVQGFIHWSKVVRTEEVSLDFL